MDLETDPEILERIQKELAGHEIFPISGASHQGLQPLLERLWQILQDEKAGEQLSAAPARRRAYLFDDFFFASSRDIVWNAVERTLRATRGLHDVNAIAAQEKVTRSTEVTKKFH